MKPRNRRIAGLLMAFTGLATACQDRPEGWTPVLEETSTAFLESETARVLDRVRSAKEGLREDPPAAENTLREAETSLEHLVAYYLPLLQARERAYNAYRSFLLEGVDQELGRIEGLLERMAVDASGGRLQEIQSLGEVLADARLAVRSGPTNASRSLEALARALNQAAVKGELILQR
jgi:hypothetical protein